MIDCSSPVWQSQTPLQVRCFVERVLGIVTCVCTVVVLSFVARCSVASSKSLPRVSKRPVVPVRNVRVASCALSTVFASRTGAASILKACAELRQLQSDSPPDLLIKQLFEKSIGLGSRTAAVFRPIHQVSLFALSSTVCVCVCVCVA